MLSNRITRIFTITIFIFIIAVLGFSGALNMGSFQKNYSESLTSSYAVLGNQTVSKIEYAVKYGKPLSNFYGIEKMLQEQLDKSNNLKSVQIVLPNGKIIYDQNGNVTNTQLTDKQNEEVNFTGKNAEEDFIPYISKEKYDLFLPIHDRNNEWIGSLVLIFDKEIIDAKNDVYLNKLLKYLLILVVVASVALLILNKLFPFTDGTNQIKRKTLLTTTLIVLGTVQIIYGMINYYTFKDAYTNVLKETTILTSEVIKDDIETVVEKGVSYDQLYGIEKYLERILSSVSGISQIRLTDGQEKVVHVVQHEKEGEAGITDNPEFIYQLELIEDQRDQNRKLDVFLSESYLNSKLNSIILDTITMIVTSFLFTVELTLLVIILLKRQMARESNVKDQNLIKEEELSDKTIVRPLAFIVFFAIFLTTSFIPIVMKRLYEPLFGLPENVVLALPLTLEMLCAGITTIICGYLIDKKGWKKAFFLGLAILGIGTVLSGLANSGLLFIVTRAICGAGYGFALMAMRGYVNTAKDDNSRSKGFSAHVSGLFAGINCGVIVGALLADRLGYSRVFFVALGVILLAALFALFLENSEQNKHAHKSAFGYREGNIKAFFFNPKIVGFFVLILIPTAAASMFLDYYFPLFAEKMGVSTSNVGRAFLLNGLCVVYFGPILTKLTSKYLSFEKSILLSGFLIVIAMVSFAWKGTLLFGFIAAILLGLAESFGLAAQNNYFANLQATKAIGVGKAFGFYGNVKKIGQMSGPLIFGIAAAFGILGIGAIGIIFLGFLFLFIMNTKRPEQLYDIKRDDGVNM